MDRFFIKIILLCLVGIVSAGMAGCGKNNNAIVSSDNQASNEEIQLEMEKTVSNNTNLQADTMLDEFILGERAAFYLNSDECFFITELNMYPKEWGAYSIGEKIDLDNDGENELVISGPYGGMYLDAIKDQIIVFAEGGGTSMLLSYVYFDKAYWIVISDTTHAGRQMYTLTKYSGSDTIVDSFELKAEYWNQEEYDENSTFTYRGNDISMEEYEEIYHAVFGE